LDAAVARRFFVTAQCQQVAAPDGAVEEEGGYDAYKYEDEKGDGDGEAVSQRDFADGEMAQALVGGAEPLDLVVREPAGETAVE